MNNFKKTKNHNDMSTNSSGKETNKQQGFNKNEGGHSEKNTKSDNGMMKKSGSDHHNMSKKTHGDSSKYFSNNSENKSSSSNNNTYKNTYEKNDCNDEEDKNCKKNNCR